MKHWLIKNRSDLRGLYGEWCRQNRSSYGLQCGLIHLSLCLTLIPIDLLFFGWDDNIYFKYRAAYLVVELLLIYFWRRFRYDCNNRRHELLGVTFYFGMVLLWNALYAWFLYIAPPAHHQIIIAAFYMNIFATSFHLTRFWRMQYAATAMFMAFFGSWFVLKPEWRHDAMSLMLWTWAIFLYCWAQRREFCAGLFSKYEMLRAQLPPKVAHFMTTAAPDVDLAEAFKPFIRPCACVCIDWRSFQALASSAPPEVVATQIQTVHDTILELLAETVTNRSYYADWTADEIFVTIYSASDDAAEVHGHVWRFCMAFTTTIRTRLQQTYAGQPPVMDIGAAVGSGLVGLLGPTTMKKTTIIGALGGVAKRLESAAKKLREAESTTAAPILCINQALFAYGQEADAGFAAQFVPLKAAVKDLEGQAIYAYAERMAPVVRANVS